ncbi:MAG TPA: nuclear transport factor 2 family protein [Candidatus Methylomirabilis sp.]|nr:nuclear transport factor 2 family protein [Candidatus Methylomirabilis sp.]
MAENIVFDGGSEADHRRVLELQHAYLDANATFDWDKLQKIWSADPSDVFFNMNGHTYVGLSHWTALWKYYRDRIETGLWEPFDIKVIIRGDLAVVTCHRRTRRRWKGTESERPAEQVDKSFISRSTMVMLREGGDWKTVHAHFSEASPGPRPGDV